MPITAVYATKGGQGVTTTAATLAILTARAGRRTLLVDTTGDLAAILNITSDRTEPGLAEYLEPASHITLNTITTNITDSLDIIHRGNGPITYSTHTYGLLTNGLGQYDHVIIDTTDQDYAWTLPVNHRVLVTRPCYLALRRAPFAPPPTAIVVINEPGRALNPNDIEAVIGIPVTATVPYTPTISRTIDAGLLNSRLPRELTRALRHVVTELDAR